ncbi:MAG TPA: HAMP domain-containing sensor histidine kinase [Burkholderiaceae bacterium]|nr:HAMP domain-containing sensor histidine kinase [Burkholderiaceae bacterium]
MNARLSRRLAAMLTAMFIAIGALLMGLSLRMQAAPQMVEIGAELMAGAIAFALLAALLVFNLLTRRLTLLGEAMEAFRESRFRQPGRLDWARSDGDEIDRLAHAFGDLAERIASQLDELERHDAQRRQLLANVSHDLRTPLTLMQGYLETMLLRHGEMSRPEERSCLEVATRHAERLTRLVADLFELAKLDGPDAGDVSETFSLSELVQDLAQKFAMHAADGGVRVEAMVCEGPALVHGRIGFIERALENLLDNALRHTLRGGRVSLDVGCRSRSVQVSVRDTGCGIASECLPHVFDRYFRAARIEGSEGATRTVHAGLGLAIAKRVVELHGGSIRVESTLGVGTVFLVELPLVEPDPVRNIQEESCRSASSSCCPA